MPQPDTNKPEPLDAARRTGIVRTPGEERAYRAGFSAGAADAASTPSRPDLREADIDRMFGEDGEVITTGVAKNRLRAWLRASEAAAKWRFSRTMDIPRWEGDTDALAQPAPAAVREENR